MGLTRTTVPTELPIIGKAVKDHLVVQVDDEDDELLRGFMEAATAYAEEQLKRSLLTQTWTWTFDRFPWAGRLLLLPRPPLASVTTLKYYATDGTLTTWDAANYIVDTGSRPGRLALAPTISWPDIQTDRISAVEVVFVAGDTTKTSVPEPIKQALYMLVGHWYENREATVQGTISKELEFAVTNMLSHYVFKELY